MVRYTLDAISSLIPTKSLAPTCSLLPPQDAPVAAIQQRVPAALFAAAPPPDGAVAALTVVLTPPATPTLAAPGSAAATMTMEPENQIPGAEVRRRPSVNSKLNLVLLPFS